MLRLFIFLFTSFFLFSCASFLKHNQQGSSKISISHKDQISSKSYDDLKRNYASKYGSMPIEDHPRVDMWLRYFTGKGRGLMTRYLERSARYIPLMKTIMREKGLPEDLVYVALIESGFQSKAHSHAGAVGYWQFIQGTGRRYGLRIDRFVDERRDPLLSTRAAAEYFLDLYSLFGSWHLALAAYNAGEYRINRLVLRYYDRNFWNLAKKKALPSETKNYVPKLIAATRIAKNPKKYGFYNVNYTESLNYDIVAINKSISLKKLAKNLNLEYKEIQSLNPIYKGEYVPIYSKDTFIRVPLFKKTDAAVAMNQSIMSRPKYAYYDHYWYKVRRGDTLSQIARRNRTTISNLKRLNRIRNKSFIRAGQKIKIPSRKLLVSKINHKSSSKKIPRHYTVKRGDTLNKISRKYNVSVARLKSMNGLKKNIIHPKQKIVLKKVSRSIASTKKSASKSKLKLANAKGKVHIVKRGETLIGIAKAHKVNLLDLMKINSLNFKTILLTGSRLLIPN